MSVEVVGIAILAVVFGLSILRGLNMGLLALAAAYILGVLHLGLPVGDVLKGFPGGLFVVLLGVTFLFGIARANGTVDWLVAASMALVRERAQAVPWMLFGLAAVLAAIGAASPAAVAIVAPVGITFAVRHHINPLYAGLLAVNGAAAGSFSPIGILGGIVRTTLAKNGLSVDTMALFAGTFAFNAALSVVVWLVLGRKRQSSSEAPQLTSAAGEFVQRAEPGRRHRWWRGGTATVDDHAADCIRPAAGDCPAGRHPRGYRCARAQLHGIRPRYRLRRPARRGHTGPDISHERY